MAIKFLYIDDENDDIVKGIANTLSRDTSKLSIEHGRALSWNEQIWYFTSNLNNYQGLLLDLQLKFPIPGQQLVYNALALAQEVRTLIKKGDLNDLPIFLCSTDNNFSAYYDETGQDLFDECFDKTTLGENDAVKFIAHPHAYKKILNKPDDLNNLLQVQLQNISFLNDVEMHFSRCKTVHQKAGFLLKQVIQPTGIFINEDLLAIRLGIDTVASSPQVWEALKSQLEPYRYKGIYAELQNLWWMQGVNQWWKDNFPAAGGLALLAAVERVELLKMLPNLSDLMALGNPDGHSSTKFWYQCTLSKKPVDTEDGLTYTLFSIFSWQNSRFVSISYLQQNGTLDIFESLKRELNPYELKKLENLKAQLQPNP